MNFFGDVDHQAPQPAPACGRFRAQRHDFRFALPSTQNLAAQSFSIKWRVAVRHCLEREEDSGVWYLRRESNVGIKLLFAAVAKIARSEIAAFLAGSGLLLTVKACQRRLVDQQRFASAADWRYNDSFGRSGCLQRQRWPLGPRQKRCRLHRVRFRKSVELVMLVESSLPLSLLCRPQCRA